MEDHGTDAPPSSADELEELDAAEEEGMEENALEEEFETDELDALDEEDYAEDWGEEFDADEEDWDDTDHHQDPDRRDSRLAACNVPHSPVSLSGPAAGFPNARQIRSS